MKIQVETGNIILKLIYKTEITELVGTSTKNTQQKTTLAKIGGRNARTNKDTPDT